MNNVTPLNPRLVIIDNRLASLYLHSNIKYEERIEESDQITVIQQIKELQRSSQAKLTKHNQKIQELNSEIAAILKQQQTT
jgi:hypothetical protein